MESTQSEIVTRLAKLTTHLFNTSTDWKRLRIAVTEAELFEYRAYCIARGYHTFVHYFRGIPLYVEEHPEAPVLFMEYL